MFIELPNDERVNIDNIEMYKVKDNILIIFFKGENLTKYEFSTKQEAEYFLQALDRAVGIKQLMIRK